MIRKLITPRAPRRVTLACLLVASVLASSGCGDNDSKPPADLGQIAVPEEVMRPAPRPLDLVNSMQCIAFTAYQQMRAAGLQTPFTPEELHDRVRENEGKNANPELPNRTDDAYNYLKAERLIDGWYEVKTFEALEDHLARFGVVGLHSIDGLMFSEYGSCVQKIEGPSHSFVAVGYSKTKQVVFILEHYGPRYGEEYACFGGGVVEVPYDALRRKMAERRVRAYGLR